jgi:hypothetical protein
MSPITKEIIKTFLGLSVFKRPSIGFYFGKIRLGAPYFYPRKWVKNKDGSSKTVYVKWLWLQIVRLGFKSKWSSEDIRYEWPPSIHIIICKLQIVFWLKHDNEDDYWKSIILYTDFNGKSEEEKINRVFENESFMCKLYKSGVEITECTKQSVFTNKFLKIQNEKQSEEKNK